MTTHYLYKLQAHWQPMDQPDHRGVITAVKFVEGEGFYVQLSGGADDGNVWYHQDEVERV